MSIRQIMRVHFDESSDFVTLQKVNALIIDPIVEVEVVLILPT